MLCSPVPLEYIQPSAYGIVQRVFTLSTSPFYAIRSALSSTFFEFRKNFFDLAKSPKKDYQAEFCAYWRRTFPLDKCRIAKHEKLSSCFFEKNKKYLSNKNRYLQAHCLQVPEKIDKNKLRKEDKKKDLQAFCSQVLDFITYL